MSLTGAYTVWIGNMPKDVPASLVHMLLATCNVVKPSDIVGLNLYRRAADASAHVSVDDPETFDRLMKLNGTHLFPASATDGKKLDVRRARVPKARKVFKYIHSCICIRCTCVLAFVLHTLVLYFSHTPVLYFHMHLCADVLCMPIYALYTCVCVRLMQVFDMPNHMFRLTRLHKRFRMKAFVAKILVCLNIGMYLVWFRRRSGVGLQRLLLRRQIEDTTCMCKCKLYTQYMNKCQDLHTLV